MTTKFFEEFTKITDGKFNMLKFAYATYDKAKKKLEIKFLISAFEVQEFGDAEKQAVLEVCKKMFDGVAVTVEYQRTYADEPVVKNKVLEFFNKSNPLIFRNINENSMHITVDSDEIIVKLTFETPMYKILTADNLIDKLTEFLDHNFNHVITVETEEKVVDLKSLDLDTVEIETTAPDSPDARIISVEVGKKVFVRGKGKGIPHQPGYIIDIKQDSDNVVLCGKMFGLSRKMYQNKKYDPDHPDPKHPEYAFEKLPLEKFFLDDTTSKIPCVAFPQTVEDGDKIDELGDGATVVCVGKVAKSQYDSVLTFTVFAMFECTIDFDSIQLIQEKSVPKKYTTVFPKPYVDFGQNSLLDDGKTAPDYFLGKTFVIYDLEATDKVVGDAEIIEIAACKVVDGVIKETFQTLVKPTCVISETIINLTHIDNLMVADAPAINDVIPDFFKFAQDSILVGHNIFGYDFPLIKIYADKLGYVFNNEMRDTLVLARQYLSGLKSFSLESLSKEFGISHENAHRAMSDVLATFEVFKIIASKM